MSTLELLAPVGPPPNPFKSLDYFEHGDMQRFDGRDHAIQAVAGGVVRNRTFVLYGPSGSGKTSLILAGLFPEFDRRGNATVYVRTLDDPLNDFRAALADYIDREFLRPDDEEHPAQLRDDSDLELLVPQASSLRPLVIVFDQFEEFFVRFREAPERREQFIQTLGVLLSDQSLHLHVLFSLRQDYLAELDDLRGRMPMLQQNEYRLQLLTAFGARQSIASQLRAADVPYDPDFLTGVVDVLAEVGFDPTILQMVGSEAYSNAVRRDPLNVRLRREDVAAIGDIKSLFQNYLTRLSAALEKPDSFPTRAILLGLTTPERTKRSARVTDLMAAGFVTSEEEIQRILELLIANGLVRKDPRAQPARFELVHERLVPALLEWLDTDPAFTSFRRARNRVHDAADDDLHDPRPDALLPAGLLADVVGQWRNRLQLDAHELDFLLRSAIKASGENPKLTDQVTYWSSRLDRTHVDALLQRLLRDPDASLRRGAAVAVRVVSSPALVDQLTGVAITDSEETVRSAAADSLALVGAPEHFERIKQALGTKTTRDAAYNALIRRRQRGGATPGLNLWHHWMIERRAIGEAKALPGYRDATRLGTIRGARAGIDWTITIGVLSLLLMSWTRGSRWEDVTWLSLAGAIAVLALVAGAIGAVLGRSSARTASQQRAARLDPSWLRIAFRSRMPYAVSVGAVILVSWLSEASSQIVFGFNLESRIFSGLLLTVVFISVTLFMVAWHSLVYAHEVSERRARLWAIVLSGGFPITLFGGLQWPVTQARPDEELALLCTLTGLAISLIAHAIAFSLYRKGVAPAEPVRPAMSGGGLLTIGVGLPTSAARMAAATFVLVNGVGFFAQFGADTIPLDMFAKADTVLEGSLGPGYPDADYHRIRLPSTDTSRPSLVGIRTLGTSTAVRVMGAYSYGWRGSYVLLAPGIHTPWIAITSSDSALDYRVDLAHVETHDRGASTDARSDQHSFFLARFKASKDGFRPDTLDGVIRGAVAGDSIQMTILSGGVAVEAKNPFSGYVTASSPAGAGTQSWPVEFNRRAVNAVLDAEYRAILKLPLEPSGRWSAILNFDTVAGRPSRSSTIYAVVAVSLIRPTTDTALDTTAVRLDSSATTSATQSSQPDKAAQMSEKLDSALVLFKRNKAAAQEQFAALAVEVRTTRDAWIANNICWQGGLRGFGEQVLPACEHAVSIQPNGSYRDSRGVARAATGDVKGAIEDFEAFLVSKRGTDTENKYRRDWIVKLQNGENPFTDPKALEEIRRTDAGVYN